jgi:hypothetical protein
MDLVPIRTEIGHSRGIIYQYLKFREIEWNHPDRLESLAFFFQLSLLKLALQNDLRPEIPFIQLYFVDQGCFSSSSNMSSSLKKSSYSSPHRTGKMSQVAATCARRLSRFSVHVPQPSRFGLPGQEVNPRACTWNMDSTILDEGRIAIHLCKSSTSG